MDFLSMTVTLILIMDPIGNIPIFLSTLDKVPENRRKKVLLRELFIALAVITFFLFCGRYFLSLMGLRQESITIAGGIILFLIALKMIFPPPAIKSDEKAEPEEEPFIVPLAVPMMAGPSLLAMIVYFSSGNLMLLGLSSLSAWIVSLVVLMSAMHFSKHIHRRGIIAMERLMGMVLVSLSIQMFLDGITAYLQKYPSI